MAAYIPTPKGGGFTPSAINRNLFPQLTEIVQRQLKKIIDISHFAIKWHQHAMGHNYTRLATINWAELLNEAQTAEEVLSSEIALKNICEKFSWYPSEDGISVMMLLLRKMNHSLISRFGISRFGDSNQHQIIQSFINTWKGCLSSYSEKVDLGLKITDLLFELIFDKSIEAKSRSSIWDAIQKVFKVPDSRSRGGSAASSSAASSSTAASSEFSDNIRWTEDTIAILQRLLVNLRKIGSRHLQKMVHDIWFGLEHLERDLFNAKNVNEPLIRRIKFMAETLVELSQLNLEGEANKYVHRALNKFIRDPETVTRQKYAGAPTPLGGLIMTALDSFIGEDTTIRHGLSYPLVTPYWLAAAFAAKLPQEMREELLRNILNNFGEYKSDSHYPLCKLVLGNLIKENIPVSERRHLLAERAIAYDGVFREEVPNELKEAYFDALCQGRLGGYDAHLIECLQQLYQSEETSDTWKNKIINTLRSLSGVGYASILFGKKIHLPTDDPLQQQIREVLNAIGK